MISKRSRNMAMLLTGVAALFGASCASVTVRKVPTPTQYVRWTDRMQRDADRMEGIRFYLPRPFVNVFESFPVRTDIYLASGTVSPDGKHVLVNKLVSLDDPSRVFDLNEINRPLTVPTLYIKEGATTPQTAKPGEGKENPLSEFIARVLSSKMQAEKKPAPPRALTDLIGPPGPTQPRTGIERRKVTNDNMAFAYQPLRGNFDLVYMPDFEEQYVVSGVAGLGNVQFEVNLGQGWSLQGFNSLADNSELNRRIFHLIDTAMTIAQAAATAALGLPALPGLPLPAGVTQVTTPQASFVKDDVVEGAPVSLKVVVVHYAAKGIYPVIKPRELQERVISQESYPCFLGLGRPRVWGVSDVDPFAIERAQREIQGQVSEFSVPRYPYQYVSFNTFRYVAIETIGPTDGSRSPFEHLYDRTGTKGEVGGARVSEIVDIVKALRQVFPDPATQEPPEKPEKLDAAKWLEDSESFEPLRSLLQNVLVPSQSMNNWSVTLGLVEREGPSPTTLTVSASFSGAPGSPFASQAAVEEAIRKHINFIARDRASWDRSQTEGPVSAVVLRSHESLATLWTNPAGAPTPSTPAPANPAPANPAPATATMPSLTNVDDFERLSRNIVGAEIPPDRLNQWGIKVDRLERTDAADTVRAALSLASARPGTPYADRVAFEKALETYFNFVARDRGWWPARAVAGPIARVELIDPETLTSIWGR